MEYYIGFVLFKFIKFEFGFAKLAQFPERNVD